MLELGASDVECERVGITGWLRMPPADPVRVIRMESAVLSGALRVWLTCLICRYSGIVSVQLSQQRLFRLFNGVFPILSG